MTLILRGCNSAVSLEQLPSLHLPAPTLPCAALRLPCLENQSPWLPIAHQALPLPLPAAPHRGVFRGADVTVHVTAPSSPGLSSTESPSSPISTRLSCAG